MKHFIITSILALGLVATPAMAGSVDINDFDLGGLSKTQKIELLKNVEDMKTAAKEVTAETVSEWAMLGKEVASAFIALAAELGKSVDEVLTTTVGKVALVLIIYKVMGNDILGVIGGAIWLMLFVPGWIYYMRKFMIVGTVHKEYYEGEKGKTGGVKTKTVESLLSIISAESRIARAWTFGLLLGVGIVIELFLVFA
ncbi:hypothetical protein LCGC14_1069240 [marine sediment metagenome]|uniref:Uncharacterized protein n=1 Tax=marine sediment metagenome TaxID=412755 RepID=A0A0F9N5S0_9ZZZZ